MSYSRRTWELAGAVGLKWGVPRVRDVLDDLEEQYRKVHGEEHRWYVWVIYVLLIVIAWFLCLFEGMPF